MQPIDLSSIKDGEKVSGLLYITDYSKKLDMSSRAPLYGTVHHFGKTVKFKIWDAQLQSIFNSNELVGAIIHAEGVISAYKDNLEVALTTIRFDHGVTDTNLFYKSVDVENVFNRFVDFVNTNLSQQGVAVLTHVFQTEGLFEPFKTTWAGAKMHDAQVGGLMHHTLKMLNIAKTLLENDNRLAEWSDLLLLGIIFHDIGKVFEMDEGGIYTLNSFVTHRTMGVEIITKYKTEISDVYGETFYYHILAIQQGHHGEHGDKPTTIWAYIVHLIDMVEAHVTGFLDKFENGEYKVRNGQKTVWMGTDNPNLVV